MTDNSFTHNVTGMVTKKVFCILQAELVTSQTARNRGQGGHTGWCLLDHRLIREEIHWARAVIYSIQEHGTAVHLDGKG